MLDEDHYRKHRLDRRNSKCIKVSHDWRVLFERQERKYCCGNHDPVHMGPTTELYQKGTLNRTQSTDPLNKRKVNS